MKETACGRHALIAVGQDLYFRLVAAPGKDLKISSDFTIPNQADFFLRYVDLPDKTNFDQSATSGELAPRLVLTQPQGGSYYILLHGREDAVGGVPELAESGPQVLPLLGGAPHGRELLFPAERVVKVGADSLELG